MPSSDDARCTSGVPGLDDILSGGFPRGRLCLVQGTPGAGKTTLALQFLLAGLARKEQGLYVSMSETREELESVAASHGWSLDGLDVLELSEDEQEENTLFHPAEVELGERMQLARNGREAVLTVSDDGIGISREHLSQVFDLFMQAPSALDRARGGLGLGPSAVAQALAEPFDIAVVDIGLPGFDGYEVARRIRAAMGSRVFLAAATGYGSRRTPSARSRLASTSTSRSRSPWARCRNCCTGPATAGDRRSSTGSASRFATPKAAGPPRCVQGRASTCRDRWDWW